MNTNTRRNGFLLIALLFGGQLFNTETSPVANQLWDGFRSFAAVTVIVSVVIGAANLALNHSSNKDVSKKGLDNLVVTKDNLDLDHAKSILDENHIGMEIVKQKILDFIASRKNSPDSKPPILCLSGPAGVGKTSIAKSIANCMGRRFAVISLGCILDVGELGGVAPHYQSARSSLFTRALISSGSVNPVILLDEVDKLSKPELEGALMEALDPDQNKEFFDRHYWKTIDLSNVLFIATANFMDSISEPLKDRMDVIEIPGYSFVEKMVIAKSIIIPRTISRMNLDGKGFEISDDVLLKMILDYTPEPGLRGLTRHVETLCMKAARAIAEERALPVFTEDNLSVFLGEPKVKEFVKAGKVSKYISVDDAKKILDSEHEGLGKAKERILDFISAEFLRKEPSGKVLCLQGPPGIGKTTLASSMAKSLGRPFALIQAGGISSADEAKLNFILALKKAGSSNAVILIDEIDKMGSPLGDPTSVFLELLDPVQNKAFASSTILGGIDFSKVLFIATTNDLSKISKPLFDRMEVISLSGYTTNEKVKIAKKHIIPRLIQKAGLEGRGIEFPDDVLFEIIEDYTSEDGIRSLSAKINILCEKCARAIADKKDIPKFSVKNLSDYLGPKAISLSARLPGGGCSDLVIDKENIDLEKAKMLMDESHLGMSKVKEKVLDFLVSRKMNPNSQSRILCLVGPPGTGKTTIAKSVAKSMGRRFQRIALGGIHDSAGLAGYARSYQSPQPGAIYKALQAAKSANPVIVLDEIDKLGTGSHNGNPGAVLLEVLDPDQNNRFYDHYIESHLDLSRVLFIATANDLDKISAPLRDRMEIIKLENYSTEEKLNIAKSHIIPKVIKDLNLCSKGFGLSDSVLLEVIDGYTCESGVRVLTQRIRTLGEKFARAILLGKGPLKFDETRLQDFIGVSRNRKKKLSSKGRIGVVNALAYTTVGGHGVGGNAHKVEALFVPRKGESMINELKITGNVGDMWQDAANTAMSYLRGNAEKFKISRDIFSKFDLHVHTPCWGVEGPSAGAATTTAILSAATKRPIKGDWAMTGEIDLYGHVGAIGGVRDKVLGARSAGATNVILPEENRQDWEEVKDQLTGIKVHFVSNFEQIVRLVLID
ncbi:AAA family ATPase [Candidatus Dependentiae bacterium]